MVAISHIAFAYADHIGPGLGLPRLESSLGQAAIALFFIVSGYIMVVSSQKLYAAPGATRVFWTRRCIRILPPYWLASLFLVGVMLWLDRDLDWGFLASSLALVPTASGDFLARPVFLLWPGWTLFYEMVFYLLFGLGLPWGRKPAIAIACFGIIALVTAGWVLESDAPAWISITRPVLLIFLVGIALAVMRESGVIVPPVMRWASLALAIAAFIAIPAPPAPSTLDLHYVLWAGSPALLLAIAVMGGPLAVPAPALFDRLGDASYALYLLHVPLAMLAISLFPLRLGAWPFFVFAVLLAYGVSILAFVLVERPLTQALNRKLKAVPRDDALLQQTGI